MHYHCEIVMPPGSDVEATVKAVLEPFNESPDEKSEDYDRSHAFWDWWVIGGRWAGHKRMAKYDEKKLAEFHEWLDVEKVTVSSFSAGKQELSPASQIPKVDAKWNEMFPSDTPTPCPLFKHSNNQYANSLEGVLPDDVMRLGDTPRSLKCSRVIFTKPSYESESKDFTGPVEAGFMLCDSQWNDCNHMPIAWDQTFGDALEKYLKDLSRSRDEYRAKVLPTDDWLVVTVDYHT